MIKIAVQDNAVLSAQMSGDIRAEVMALVFHLYNKDKKIYQSFVDSVKITEMIIEMEENYHGEDDYL